MYKLPDKKKILMPLYFALVLVAGIMLGTRLNQPFLSKKAFVLNRSGQFNKLNDIINYIQMEYVDTVNYRMLVENAIESMLHELDPHSAYITAEDLQAMSEPLEGNFDGIGVEFHIQNDTIMVVSPLSGGPSEALGIQSGDRIIQIEDTLVAGIGIDNSMVMQKLRGPSGTQVSIKIMRKGKPGLIDYTITRGKIPINSVDVAYMIRDKTGYIKVSRFAATTYDEFADALGRLRQQGMESLILDLRGNPGGYLNAATMMADEFLDRKKLIVYTEGKARPRTPYYAKNSGMFLKGDMVVLVDEGSASASEILAGALQDWDRATIIGRRSFGKGLVQEQTVFPDGSALRLTIARYYTPTGRSIQKPYAGGFEDYNRDLLARFERGELGSQDSIQQNDSLRFTTPGGKSVYGGGGIMPDIFVPLDTSFNTPYLTEVINKGLIVQFAYDYVDANRNAWDAYPDAKEFVKSFKVTDALYDRFVNYSHMQGVPAHTAGAAASKPLISARIKAYIARQLFKSEGFFPVLNQTDNAVAKALEVLEK